MLAGMGIEPTLHIETSRLVLRLPSADEAEAAAEFQRRCRAGFAPWEPPRPESFYTAAFWRGRLSEHRAEAEAGRSLSLFLFAHGEPARALGFAHFSQIVRGPFQACYLGYGIDPAAQGQGLMAEALGAGLDVVFTRLLLHRVMANYRPENVRSARLLARLGFVVEGLARDYLFIDGAWRDHVLSARINPAAPPPG
jgi:ribosomal-protein-alanine N-acetyltransferase